MRQRKKPEEIICLFYNEVQKPNIFRINGKQCVLVASKINIMPNILGINTDFFLNL